MGNLVQGFEVICGAGMRTANKVVPIAMALSIWLAMAAVVSQALADGTIDHPGPAEAIIQFTENVEAARQMEADDLYVARLTHLVPVIGRHFDIGAMSRMIVGRSTWRGWSEDEQQDFVGLMRRFIAATIVGRLDIETDQPTEVREVVEGPSGTMTVRTKSFQSGEAIDVDYRVRETADGWQIVDIVANSTVSEVALRRAEFVGIIRAKGYAGIVAALEQKLEQLERAGV